MGSAGIVAWGRGVVNENPAPQYPNHKTVATFSSPGVVLPPEYLQVITQTARLSLSRAVFSSYGGGPDQT